MSGQEDDSEKSFEPTQHKLDEARKKGEIAKSMDVSVAAGYLGLTIAFLTVGAGTIKAAGNGLMVLLDQAESLAPLVFEGNPSTPIGGILMESLWAVTPWFGIPMIAVILSVIAQNAFLFVPSKVAPKLSRINPLSNAKNKFGRSGLFEFAKSFAKLVIYSVCLGFFLKFRMAEMASAIQLDAIMVPALLGRLMLEFLMIVIVVAASIATVDYFWQRAEHMRKNMMTRKEMTDEQKDSEGDPHTKQKRRQKGQEIAMNQMLADVPDADVVIVNPTHYAVALKWTRMPGEAPVCVAKGVDEIAARIRETAQSSAVPIHRDPPTARALHAIVEIGQEIPPDQYRPVAAAIRFADAMRQRAKGKA
ncbi:EscU/YscU/HrcU family type III secretion system export apparatus switch protein [Shimia sp. NS0008-38b]|uniref:EscU/YscU/HrcU family type III secretion system export apparatus switch protein n=1 Tax=Shimia sp. NS0008-38b TaxID=3127653 RepID=UPI00310230D3